MKNKLLIATIILSFVVSGSTLMLLFDPPAAYTKWYSLRMWNLDDNPSADSLNANWIDVDSLINELIVYTNPQEMEIRNDTLRFVSAFVDSIVSNYDSLSYISLIPQVLQAPYREGRIWFDSLDQSLNLYVGEPSITQQIGREFWIRVYNANGDTIKNGEVASYDSTYIISSVPEGGMVLANAKWDSTSTAIGIATMDIPPGTLGFLTPLGLINGLNTLAWEEDDLLYLDTLDGQLTNIKPLAKYNVIPMAIVFFKHATEGAIYAAHTDLLGVGDLDMLTAYIYDNSTSISTSTTETRLTNVTNDLLTLDPDVSHNLTLTADSIIINKAGMYDVSINMSFTGSTNIIYQVYGKVNGFHGSKYLIERKTSNADVGALAFQASVNVNVGDSFSFWVVADGVSSFTPTFASIRLRQVR